MITLGNQKWDKKTPKAQLWARNLGFYTQIRIVHIIPWTNVLGKFKKGHARKFKVNVSILRC